MPGSALFLLIVLLPLAACGKSESAPSAAEPIAAAAPSTTTVGAFEPSAPVEDPALSAKRRAIEFALAEDKILHDPDGQWAKSAVASSSFNGGKGRQDFSPRQATGAPDVEKQGDNAKAWAPKSTDGGIEWLHVGFEPVNATQIKIRQSVGPGAIIRIELIDEQGGKHALFEGMDERKYDEWHWWLVESFPPTPYRVVGAKITLATNAVPGWNEIDAVQLVKAPSALAQSRRKR